MGRLHQIKKMSLGVSVGILLLCFCPGVVWGETDSADPIDSSQVFIDRETATQTDLLPPPEVAKIEALQRFIQPVVMSEISPDGTTVIFRKSGLGVENAPIFWLNVQDGSMVEMPREDFGEFEPSHFFWRDRNTAIAPVKKMDEKQSEWAFLIANQDSQNVTLQPLPLPGHLRSLSPDASRLLIELPPREDFAEMVIVDLTTTDDPIRFALPSQSEFLQAAWTPRGDKLAVITFVEPDIPPSNGVGASSESFVTQDAQGLIPPENSPFVENSVLLTFDLTQEGRGRLLTANQGDLALFSAIAWSPDGEILMAGLRHPSQPQGREHPTYNPLLGDRTSWRFYDDQLREIHRLEAPEVAAAMGTTGEFISPFEVLFTAQVRMNTHLYHYHLGTGDIRNLSDWKGTYTQVQHHPPTQELLFRYSSFVDPPEFYRMNWETGETTQITDFNDFLGGLRQFYVDAVNFELDNGEVFQGVLLQASDTPFPPQDVPFIVWQEGGPFSTIKNEWLTTVETPFALLPNFDFSLLVMPLYGRHGFGSERFLTLYDEGNFGKVDIDAMAEILEEAIARGYTSPDKIGIMGCSYGGYFTHQSIIHYPDLYAAANAQCSVLDWGIDWLQGNPARSPYFYGKATPNLDPEVFQEDSPLYYSDRITTPLLMFKGTEDFLPIALDELYVNAIAQNNIPVRFLTFSGAGHGLVNVQGQPILDYQTYAAQEMIQWFRTYLESAEISP